MATLKKIGRTIREVHDAIIHFIGAHPAATLWLWIVTPWVAFGILKIVF